MYRRLIAIVFDALRIKNCSGQSKVVWLEKDISNEHKYYGSKNNFNFNLKLNCLIL